MNNIFEIKRFGKYLSYDLNHAAKHYWISLLILGLTPVTIYAFYELLHLITLGNFGQYNDGLKITGLVISFISVILTFPVKAFGYVTERKAGTSFLMIPASSFEKWLSMIIISCIVLPAYYFVLFFGSDALMGVIFSNYGSESILNKAQGLSVLMAKSNIPESLQFNIPGLLFIEWVETILTFVLGAIFFKRSKAAKTILALMALGMVTGILTSAILGTTHIDSEMFNQMKFDSAEAFINKIKVLVSVYYTALIIALLSLSFIRIKTLKH